MEVRELEKDTEIWTLYLLGLDILQSRNQTDMLSCRDSNPSSLNQH